MYDIYDTENEDIEHEAAVEHFAYSRDFIQTQEQTNSKKQLVRELRAEALKRLEEAARTQFEFENVVSEWNRLDENRERKERYHEVGRGNNVPLEYNQDNEGVSFPKYLSSAIWKQVQRGNFEEYIFNCPYELAELVTDYHISKTLNSLSEEQKELLHYLVLRRYSTTRIAKLKGQSDRNIRKVRGTMMKRIHKNLYNALSDGVIYMTLREKRFMSEYSACLDKSD